MHKINTRLVLRGLAAISVIALFPLGIYAGLGYYDALKDSVSLKLRADALIASHHGPEDLTQRKLDALIRVEDPGFWQHNGFDVTTKGAGVTTITQSLSKRLAFEHFKPGIGKIRQTSYALGLEQRLSKKEILALFLDTAEMGQGPNGWMKGVFTASQQLYGKPPAALTDRQWLMIVAAGIAPKQFTLMAPDKALDQRVGRIERLIAGQCTPRDVSDVWLEGCA